MSRQMLAAPMPLVAALALLAVPRSGAAQATVAGIRDLAFGPVIRGIATHVTPGDPVKSGEFQFTAPIGSRVRVRFTLPTQLNGPSGATLPINFNNTDAIATGTGATGAPVSFNPNNARTFNMSSGTTALVFIGGTVTPAAGQSLGTYTNPVTLTITLL